MVLIILLIELSLFESGRIAMSLSSSELLSEYTGKITPFDFDFVICWFKFSFGLILIAGGLSTGMRRNSRFGIWCTALRCAVTVLKLEETCGSFTSREKQAGSSRGVYGM